MSLETTVVLISQVLVWGIILGCIYVLLSCGLNIIFGVMKLVNFAYGEFIILGGYVSYWIVSLFKINPYAAIVLSMLMTGVFGIFVEWTCFRKVMGSVKVNEVILSIGLIYILQSSMSLLWTDYPRGVHSPYENTVVSLGILDLNFDWVMAALITAAIMLGLYVLINWTTIGKAMKATSQNRRGAMLMGIDVERIDMFSFGVGIALAASAGTLLVITTSITPYAGSVPALKAFAIIVLGGLGSLRGAVIGGLLYGIIENVAVFTLGGTWRNAVGFVILILVLIFRPTGLFGEGE
ncbi:MAG: branched-chain amino acid ABC transporter permease [archaeon]